MAYIHSDPLDSVSTTISTLAYRWDAYIPSGFSVAINTTLGRSGGGCLTTISNNQGYVSKKLPRPLAGVGQDSLFLGVSIYLTGSATTATRSIMSGYNTAPQSNTNSTTAPWATATETWVTVGLDTTNRITLVRTGTVVATAVDPLPLTTWCRIELRVSNIDDEGGMAEVRVNGETVINFTGDLYTAGEKTLYAASFHTSSVWRLDDPMIWDSSGSSVNTFLGDLIMETLRPTGPGTTTQSTPTGAATPWQAVSEAVPNNNTSYTAINTAGHKDTYVFADSAAATGVVHAVVAVTTMKTTGMSPRKVVPVARLAGTEANGAPQPVLIDMTTGYRAEQALVPRPGGGNWTLAEINAAEFGWKVTQ